MQAQNDPSEINGSAVTLPLAFIALWSTGFVGAKFGLPFSEPYTLLSIRFLIAIAVLAIIVFVIKPSIPSKLSTYGHLFICGLLIHVCYLGGVFTAINVGLPSGITAVIVGFQPVITALLITTKHPAFSVLISLGGFLGLLLVVISDGSASLSLTSNLALYLPAIISLLGITFGTLYQKRYLADLNVFASVLFQYIPALLIFMLFAWWLEGSATIIWSYQLVFSLLWLALVLSIGAVVLMSLMYQKNSANKAANYFYLAPPLALLQGYAFFGETLTLVNMLGVGLIILCIYVSNRFLQ